MGKRTGSIQAAVIAAMAAGGLIACGDAHPTETVNESVAARLVIAPALARTVSEALTDARGRIVAGLSDADGARLSESLGKVDGALSARDRAALVSALSSAEAVVVQIAGQDDQMGADLDAVRLALGAARSTLTARTSSQ